MLQDFVAKTAGKDENLFYVFSINEDQVFCREAYESADGLLAHLDNVGALLEERLKMPDLTRVKVPGPPEELEKLKAPLAPLKSSVVYARNDAVVLTSVFYGAIIGPNVRLASLHRSHVTHYPYQCPEPR